MTPRDIKAEAKEHLQQIKSDIPDNQVINLWLKDYEEAAEQNRFYNNIAYTIFGIFFSAVVIVLGLMIDGYEKTEMIMIFIASFLSLSLIWGAATIFNRMLAGANANGTYAESIEEILFEKKIYNRSFAHKLSKDELDRHHIPNVGIVLSFVVSVFSGFSVWLPYSKYFIDANLLASYPDMKELAYWGAIPLFIFISWLIYYSWLDAPFRSK